MQTKQVKTSLDIFITVDTSQERELVLGCENTLAHCCQGDNISITPGIAAFYSLDWIDQELGIDIGAAINAFTRADVGPSLLQMMRTKRLGGHSIQ